MPAATKKLVRVELTYEDGSRAALEGEAAQEWERGASACIQTAWTRGVRMPELPWQVTPATEGT